MLSVLLLLFILMAKGEQDDEVQRAITQSCSPAPSFLQTVVHTVEAAWLRSAEQSGCWSFNVKDGEEFMNSVRLSSGHMMPSVGLGVYKSAAGGECYASVLSALRLGYRHVDTAQIYGNEGDVGRALRDSGVPRDEVFVTTKVWLSNWGYDKARASIRQSLAELATPYVDLLLLHAPGDPALRADTWRALEDAQREGLVRSIGVSNFGAPHLERLLESAAVRPAVNQLELHPWLQRRELTARCRELGIVPQAYSPLAKAQKLADPAVGAVAARLGVTPAQVLVRWSLQRGFVPLPKSNNAERQRANLDVFRFELSAADMAALDGLEEGLVTGWDPVKDAPV